MGSSSSTVKPAPSLDTIAAERFQSYKAANTLHRLGCHLICRRNGWIILISERKGKKYSLPGGKVEAGDDSPRAALARELKEETGNDFDATRFNLVAVSEEKNAINPYPYVSLLYETSQTTASAFLKCDMMLVRPFTGGVADSSIAKFTERHFQSLESAGALEAVTRQYTCQPQQHAQV